MSLLKLIRQDSYHFLLAAELIFFLLLPFIPKGVWYSGPLVSTGMAIILIAGINTLKKESLKRYGWVSAVIFVILNFTHNLLPLPQLYFTSFMFFFGLLALVEAGIVHMLLWSKSVKPSFIIGSVAGYLLISLNLAFFVVAADGLAADNVLTKSIEELGFNGILYYSLVTTTTIGFGDISPVHPFVQMVSTLAGVLAQFYIAVVVAVIVSKLLNKKN